jgi:hypothetical protein
MIGFGFVLSSAMCDGMREPILIADLLHHTPVLKKDASYSIASIMNPGAGISHISAVRVKHVAPWPLSVSNMSGSSSANNSDNWPVIEPVYRSILEQTTRYAGFECARADPPDNMWTLNLSE